MQHDAVVARIVVVPMRVPARRTQVQLHIAVDTAAVGAREHRITEIRASPTTAPALIYHAVCVATLGMQCLSDPRARCPACGKLSLAPACGHFVHAIPPGRLSLLRPALSLCFVALPNWLYGVALCAIAFQRS